jgi:hypothetical protein
MRGKPFVSEVISAAHGYSLVVHVADSYQLGESVIAWRIDTVRGDAPQEVSSLIGPLTIAGDAPDNYVGVQQPDGRIALSFGGVFQTLGEAYRATEAA